MIEIKDRQQNKLEVITNRSTFFQKLRDYFKANYPMVIIAIIGWSLTIFLFFKNQRSPGLTFLENPTKSIILEYGRSSNLRVSFKDQYIDKDISVAQIAVWNNGSEVIKNENILDTIKIITSPSVPILEVKIRKMARKIINLKFSETEFNAGRIPISWKILENNDGGIFEIIYMGKPTVNFHVDGIIQGQKKICQFKPLINKDSPISLIIIFFTAMFAVMIANFVTDNITKKILKAKPKWGEFVIGRIIVVICNIIIYLILIFLQFKLISFLFMRPTFPPWGSW